MSRTIQGKSIEELTAAARRAGSFWGRVTLELLKIVTEQDAELQRLRQLDLFPPQTQRMRAPHDGGGDA